MPGIQLVAENIALINYCLATIVNTATQYSTCVYLHSTTSCLFPVTFHTSKWAGIQLVFIIHIIICIYPMHCQAVAKFCKDYKSRTVPATRDT